MAALFGITVAPYRLTAPSASKVRIYWPGDEGVLGDERRSPLGSERLAVGRPVTPVTDSLGIRPKKPPRRAGYESPPRKSGEHFDHQRATDRIRARPI